MATSPVALRENRRAGNAVSRRHLPVNLRSMHLQQHSRRTGFLCQAYADNAMDGLDEADDFYSILGVVSFCRLSTEARKVCGQIGYQQTFAALTYQHPRGNGSCFCSQACRPS